MLFLAYAGRFEKVSLSLEQKTFILNSTRFNGLIPDELFQQIWHVD